MLQAGLLRCRAAEGEIHFRAPMNLIAEGRHHLEDRIREPELENRARDGPIDRSRSEVLGAPGLGLGGDIGHRFQGSRVFGVEP